MIRFVLMCFIAAAIFLPPKAVYAQDCSVVPETITRFEPPDTVDLSLWDFVFSDLVSAERFEAAVLNPRGHILTAGTFREAPLSSPNLLLTEFNRRGRIHKTRIMDVRGLEEVMQVIRAPEGYVVLVRIRRDERARAWLGFFDEDLELTSQRLISRSKSHVFGNWLVKAGDGAGYYLAGALEPMRPGALRQSHVFRLTGDGREVWSRSFMPGGENELLHLMPLDNGELLGSGYITGARNRRSGWLVRMTDEAKFVWERAYPRGMAARLHRGFAYKPATALVIGDAKPLGDDVPQGAWVMLIDTARGDPIWQRYFTGILDYSASDVLRSPDDLLLMIVTARQPAEPSEDSLKVDNHVRLIRLNPRGVTLRVRDFMNAAGAQGKNILFNYKQEPVIVGHTRMIYRVEQEDGAEPVQMADEAVRIQDLETIDRSLPTGMDPIFDDAGQLAENVEIRYSRDGWIIAVPPPSLYEDPCLPPPPVELR